MKTYELVCLVPSNLFEIDLDSFQEKITALLQKEQAVLNPEIKEKPVKKRVASALEKSGQAYLLTFNFQMNPAGLENLEKELKKDGEILRYAVLSKKLSKAPAVSRKPSRAQKKTSQPKVELKEIEKKLEEILGE